MSGAARSGEQWSFDDGGSTGNESHNAGNAPDGDNGDTGGSDPGSVIEPGKLTSGSSDNTGQRSRKRRSDAGQSRGPRAQKADATDLGSIAEIISEVHSMLALMLQTPELALDESKGEHEKLARALNRVAAHYNIPILDPKTRDWIMLAKTAGVIYGSRVMAVYLRMQAEKIDKPKAAVTTPKETPRGSAVAPDAAVSGVITIRPNPVPGFEHVRMPQMKPW